MGAILRCGALANALVWKRVTARGAVLSITKLIGSNPSFSPFDKGGHGDFKIDFLRSWKLKGELMVPWLTARGLLFNTF
jgi:hypothetical protein